MSDKTSSAGPEFSRPIFIDKIPAGGTEKTIEPDEGERRKLAARFGILELVRLRADLDIQSARAGQAVAVNGRFVADVIQKCVITLEPTPAHIERKIEILYLLGKDEEEGELEPDAVETEYVSDGLIDLGEMVAQDLGLALDPYPRKPGAEFSNPVKEKNKENDNPLAELASLTKKSK